MFDYPLLQFLSTIERERNFERAALSLGVSKSYLSQSLRLLEERMGGVVVCRQSVTPTYFGRMLCRHMENVSLLEHRFLTQHKSLFKVESPDPITIKVAIDNDSLSSWIRAITSTLSPSDNQYFLDILTCDASRSKEMMNLGQIHCALSISPEPLEGFDCYPLGTHYYRAVASPKFFKEHFSLEVSKDTLSKTPAMIDRDDTARLSLWIKMATGQAFTPPAHIVPSANAILNNCLDGKVWGISSSLLVDTHIEQGNLVELVPGVAVQYDLYWHNNKHLSNLLGNLIDSILQETQRITRINDLDLHNLAPLNPALGNFSEPVAE